MKCIVTLGKPSLGFNIVDNIWDNDSTQLNKLHNNSRVVILMQNEYIQIYYTFNMCCVRFLQP